jgi:hypothetical protein
MRIDRHGRELHNHQPEGLSGLKDKEEEKHLWTG